MGILDLILPKRFTRMPVDLQTAFIGCSTGVGVGILSIALLLIFKEIGINFFLAGFLGIVFLLFALHLILNAIEDKFTKE